MGIGTSGSGMGVYGGFGGDGGDRRDGGSGSSFRLDRYSVEPRYDLSTIVQLTGVRPMTLWAWERMMGLASTPRSLEDAAPSARRYSERDLHAFLWLREEVLAGRSVDDAISRLVSGQFGELGIDRGGTGSTGPARSSKTGPLLPPRAKTGPLSGAQSTGALRSPAITRQLSDVLPDRAAWSATESSFDRPYRAPASRPLYESAASGPLSGGMPPVMPGFPPEALRRSSPSHPLWIGAPGSPEFGSALDVLVRAFASFDTLQANRVLGDALAGRTVEMVCANLLLPAVVRASDMWARRELTSPEEHFAFNYARGVLYSLFYMAPEQEHGPLAVVACGPKEMFDIYALMLAVFWRRAGLRIVYLGQDVEASSLVAELSTLRPTLVTLCVNSASRVRSLAKLVKDIRQMHGIHTVVAFGGQPFYRNRDLQQKVPGVYLGDDIAQANWHMRRLLNLNGGM